MEIENALNLLIDAFIPVANKQIPKLIKDAEMDPWSEDLSGKETLGEINLGVCKAKATASYKIKDMTGLSTLVLGNVVLSKLDFSDPANIKGEITLDASQTSNLVAKVSGSVKAACGFISESVGISGKVTAKGVTGKAKGTFVAIISSEKACLESVNISSLTLNYSEVQAKIDGLGIFGPLLDPLVDLIDALFGKAIKEEIAKQLKPILNNLMNDELPFCN